MRVFGLVFAKERWGARQPATYVPARMNGGGTTLIVAGAHARKRGEMTRDQDTCAQGNTGEGGLVSEQQRAHGFVGEVGRDATVFLFIVFRVFLVLFVLSQGFETLDYVDKSWTLLRVGVPAVLQQVSLGLRTPTQRKFPGPAAISPSSLMHPLDLLRALPQRALNLRGTWMTCCRTRFS